jgi:hypothetical protein
VKSFHTNEPQSQHKPSFQAIIDPEKPFFVTCDDLSDRPDQRGLSLRSTGYRSPHPLDHAHSTPQKPALVTDGIRSYLTHK